MPAKIDRVALYARVSTKEQAERNLSLPAQLRTLQERCASRKYEVVKEYKDEGFSGTTEHRPELQQLKADIESGKIDIDAVLVIDSSRFFRNNFLRSHWKDNFSNYGVYVLSVHQTVDNLESADSELYEDLLAVFAQNESKRIGERTLRGMQENARQGYHHGARPPHGYGVEKISDDRGGFKGRLVIDLEDAEVVKLIFGLYTTEGMGALEIAKHLHEANLLPRFRKKWDKDQILRILSNPVYIGQYIYNRIKVKKNKNLGDGPRISFIERDESEWIVVPWTRSLMRKRSRLHRPAESQSELPRKMDGPFPVRCYCLVY